MSTLLVTQPQPGVTQLTLNRPEKLNAMNAELIEDLHGALDDIATDRACRAVVLTGAGRGFCAGLDLTGYGTAPGGEGLGPVQAGFSTQTHIARLIPHLRSLPVPVIAAVNGPAAGGGLALALGSDIRIAGASARFNVAFVRVGLSGCDIGVSWLLPRLIGASRAWELMLTGRIIDAARGRSHRVGDARRRRRRAHRLGPRDRWARRRQQPMGRAHDEGGRLEPARGRESAGRHRSREPHADAVVIHRRSS